MIVIKFQCKTNTNCPYYKSSLRLSKSLVRVNVTMKNVLRRLCPVLLSSDSVKSHVPSLFAAQNISRCPEDEHRLISRGVEVS